MSTLTPLIEAWDEGHREFGIAMAGMPDDELWKRPHPRLLSVGELAAHVAHWQAVWIGGGGSFEPDVSQLYVQSPLITEGVSYYPRQIPNPMQLELGTAEVLSELMRVHEAAKAEVAGKEKDDPYPGQWGTWGTLIQYQAFHVAYHAGQVYSVRHLLGHETEDN